MVVTKKILNAEMLKLAVPLLFSNLATVLIGVTDTFFAGKLGTVALGAAGIGVMWYFTLYLLPKGIVGSVIAFVSQAYGANDTPRVGRWLGNFLVLGLALLPLVFLFIPALTLLIAASGAEQAVQTLALEYVKVRVLEMPFALLSTIMIGFLVGIGDSRTPMLVNWGVVLGNIFLNWVFVFGNLGAPKLGIVGTALGSVISVGIGALIFSYIVWTRHAKQYQLRLQIPSRAEWLEMLRIGTPMGALEMLEVSAFTVFLALTARISTEALAASQVGNQISSLAFMPGFALGSATASLVGRYIGAKNLETANQATFAGVRLGMIWMGVIGIFFWVLAEPLARIFSSEENVIMLTASLLRLMAFYQLFDAANIVFRSALLGTGDTQFAAIVTLLSAWTIMVGGGYLIVTNGGGLIEIWFAPFIYLALLSMIYYLRWQAGHWRNSSLGTTVHQ
jgi:multidrug resistance protein, MATE family